MTMNKLTKLQQKVVDLMKAGWELGVSDHFTTTSRMERYCWLQKNGLGKGGLTEKVNMNTLQALISKGMIKLVPSDMLASNRIYKLTKEGKQ